jgi:uncharacterized Fe-S cluster protein YjdI/CDGSH-type Zn-finger protein
MTAEPAGRAYSGEEIAVYFDANRCRHFAECVRGAPSVFDVTRRPWIQPADAAAPQIAEVVRRCPSGALHYRLAAGPDEVPDVPTTVTVVEGGPLLVRGDVEVRGPFDAVRDTRMALCACTRSARLPFCDAACTTNDG